MVTIGLTKQSGKMHGGSQSLIDLAAAMLADADIILDTTQLATIDLSFLQIVEAARRHAAVQGGSITLSHPPGPPIRDTLDRAGLSATLTPADRSFWLHEG